MQTPWPRQIGAHGLTVPWLSHAGVLDFNTWFHRFETLSCALEMPSPPPAVSSICTGRVGVGSKAWHRGLHRVPSPAPFPRELWGCGSRGGCAVPVGDRQSLWSPVSPCTGLCRPTLLWVEGAQLVLGARHGCILG